MGVLNKSVLGTPSGAVGQIVFSKWKNKTTVKTLPSSVEQPNTESQQTNKNKLKLIGTVVSNISNYLSVGYKRYANDMTAQNAFVKTNWENCFSEEDNNVTINFASLIVSKGQLKQPTKASFSFSDNTVNISVTSDANSNQNDVLMPLVYNASKDLARYNVDDFTRQQEQCSVEIPEEWNGDECFVYLGLRAQNSKDAAPSIFLGKVFN